MPQYARYRRRYQESWLLGYKMSNGCQSLTDNPTDDNYIALAAAIILEITGKEALKLMGLAPEESDANTQDAKYKTLGKITYILNTICGLPKKQVTEIFKTDLTTINDALKHDGLYRDTRCRRLQEE